GQDLGLPGGGESPERGLEVGSGDLVEAARSAAGRVRGECRAGRLALAVEVRHHGVEPSEAEDGARGARVVAALDVGALDAELEPIGVGDLHEHDIDQHLRLGGVEVRDDVADLEA
ncbi:MAG: hypothetical protein ACK55I_38215, partial [bacterium]